MNNKQENNTFPKGKEEVLTYCLNVKKLALHRCIGAESIADEKRIVTTAEGMLMHCHCQPTARDMAEKYGLVYELISTQSILIKFW